MCMINKHSEKPADRFTALFTRSVCQPVKACSHKRTRVTLTGNMGTVTDRMGGIPILAMNIMGSIMGSLDVNSCRKKECNV